MKKFVIINEKIYNKPIIIEAEYCNSLIESKAYGFYIGDNEECIFVCPRSSMVLMGLMAIEFIKKNEL